MSDKIEIEVNEDGTYGTFPEDFQKFFDKRLREQYQKGADKSERALSSLIVDPKELEDLRGKAKAHEDLQLEILERDKKYEEAREMREKRHADEVNKERELHKGTKNKVREFVVKSVRAAAVEAGAVTDKRLDALVSLFEKRVDLNDELTPIVKGDDGKPLVDDKGELVTIEGFVKQYLDSAPEWKAAPSAKGGKAPGGATYRGSALPSGKDALRAAIDSDEGSSPKMQTAFIGSVLRKAG